MTREQKIKLCFNKLKEHNLEMTDDALKLIAEGIVEIVEILPDLEVEVVDEDPSTNHEDV